MFYDFIDDTGSPVFAVSTGVLAGKTFLAEVRIILKAEISAISVLMFDELGLYHTLPIVSILII